MRKETSRTRKIGELMQREIAQLLTREVNDPRVARITITSVDVAPDLSHAKIYFTHLAGEDEAPKVQRALKGMAGFLRHRLRELIDLRTIPELRFVYDTAVERGARINELLERVRVEDGKPPKS
jgi:ribosome-binding factor A